MLLEALINCQSQLSRRDLHKNLKKFLWIYLSIYKTECTWQISFKNLLRKITQTMLKKKKKKAWCHSPPILLLSGAVNLVKLFKSPWVKSHCDCTCALFVVLWLNARLCATDSSWCRCAVGKCPRWRRGVSFSLSPSCAFPPAALSKRPALGAQCNVPAAPLCLQYLSPGTPRILHINCLNPEFQMSANLSCPQRR